MALVVFTDHTRTGITPSGRLGGALVFCWIDCDGCGRRLSRQEVGGGEWERGIVSADAALNYGCRWTTGQKPDHRTSRPFCPACQRIVVVGPFGWSDGRRFGLPPAALPDPGQLALPGVAS